MRHTRHDISANNVSRACVCVCQRQQCEPQTIASYETVCVWCVITKMIKLWARPCCCHGLKCFRICELLFLSRAKHPIWGGSQTIHERAAEDERMGEPGKHSGLMCGCFRVQSGMMMIIKMMMMMMCAGCRRTTTYRSALTWCSRNSWSSTVRGEDWCSSATTQPCLLPRSHNTRFFFFLICLCLFCLFVGSLTPFSSC